MSNKIIISIIIPTYNTELYISRCIDSILLQNNQHIEILAIDDGSKDNTKKILSEYSNKYSNFHTIYCKHIGIANIRNLGIENAKGQYIMFVDSDDFIEKNLINNLLKAIDNYSIDIIRYGVTVHNDTSYKNKERFNCNKYGIIESKEALNLWSSIGQEYAVLWMYCIKKSLFQNIKFKENRLHEDFGTIPKILLKSNTILSLNYKGYNYIKRQHSIIENHDKKYEWKKSLDYLYQYDQLLKFYKKELLLTSDYDFFNHLILDLKNRMPEKLVYLSSPIHKLLYRLALKIRNIEIKNSYSFLEVKK